MFNTGVFMRPVSIRSVMLALSTLAIFAVFAGTALPALALGYLPDGRWRITLRGEGTHLLCYGQLTRIGEVRRGRPVYRGKAKFTYRVQRNGRVLASGHRLTDRASLQGRITATHGRGTFHIPTRSCRGTWEVQKVGN